jgi:glycosyltransferase involved in cell wall biosynthesis
MTPAVSVITPAYNYGRFLPGAIESVLGQTLGELELIIIDDGSTDDTPAVVRRYGADRRLRYFRVERIGHVAAKNVGLRLAEAPLVAFLDADDLWLPQKLERQAALFRADPTLGVVYTRALWVDETGQELEREQPRLHRGEVLDELFRHNFVCFSSAVVRADVFHTVGLFDEGLPLAADFDLWLRAAMHYRFDYVDAPLVKYRTGHSSLSRRLEERLRTAQRIMDRFLDHHGGRAIVDPAVVRRARAETFYHLGLVRRRRSALAALPCFLRALALRPGYWGAWKGLASLALAEKARQWCRVALGKPADWSVRRPVVREALTIPCQQ